MEQDKKKALTQIEYKYRESPIFRNVHASGAYGTILPNGTIYMAVYSEHAHLPTTSRITVNADGVVVEAERMSTPEGLMRDVEVALMFDLNTAVGLRQWLDDKISTMEKIQQEFAKKQADALNEQRPA